MDKTPIFIHIPKNGGLALKRTLRANKDGGVAAINPPFLAQIPRSVRKNIRATTSYTAGRHHGFHHLRYRDIESNYVKENFQPFALVRNPWQRVYSSWTYYEGMLKHRIPHLRHGKNKDFPYNFEEFVNEREKYRKTSYKSNWLYSVRNWVLQKEYVIDSEENLAADILRFEHYEEDLNAYTGIEKFKKFNVSYKSIPFEEAYTPELIQIVGDWYKDDIDFFGFDFDTSATKNIWSK